jgi:glutamine synthetase
MLRQRLISPLVRLAMRGQLVRHSSAAPNVIAQKVLNDVANHNDLSVKLVFTDGDGVMRGKYINIDKFKSSIDKDIGFCNVIFGWDISGMPNATHTHTHTTRSDLPNKQVRLDL